MAGTGYKHHFPFLHPSLRLKTANTLCVESLHDGVVWPTNPKLFYIGMQDQWFTFNMFDAQVGSPHPIVWPMQTRSSQCCSFSIQGGPAGRLGTREM